ncbi:MAG: helix-turn-helix domain-containing protein [Lentisphaeria bacterium]|nr:helix-turn-helix domain-containing protein [Lentisphaeria bacterium]
MAELSLKEQFTRTLRGALRASGVPRGELIRQLDVSASALSQMLSGALVPTLPRLDRIIEVLHPPVAVAEQLQTMLLWLRSGALHYPSAFNRRLFMARCSKKLTHEQLAELASMTVNRLRRLERTAYAEPTAAEVLTLSRLLDYPLSGDPVVDTPVGGAGPEPLLAAENSIPEGGVL